MGASQAGFAMDTPLDTARDAAARDARSGRRSRRQQHDDRAGAALRPRCLRERDDLAALGQPAVHLGLEHRLPARRAVALAVDDAQAAQAALLGAADERANRVARFIATHAMKVELVL